MNSILYVRLPCNPIYPGGVVQLASYIHRQSPETKQKILDLALVKKRRRKNILKETIKDFSPDIVAFSLRDIQIFSPRTDSPTETTDGLIMAMKLRHGNILDRTSAALNAVKYLLGYRERIRENLILINELASLYPGKRIVLGGGAISIFANHLQRALPPRTLCVIGEGEEALLKVVSGQTNEEIGESQRVVYKDRDGLVHTGRGSSWMQLEDEEGIDFKYIASIFPDFSQYLKGTIGIQTKRGCPHQCIFCLYNYIEGKRIRYRPAGAILKEIESLYFDFGVRDFYFTDSQFIPNKEALSQVEAILDGIISKGLSINWQGYLRIEDIDYELAKKIVKSGLTNLELSIGSGSQRIVDRLKLGLRLNDVLEKARLIKRAGFKGRISLDYCLNSPGESKETLMESIDFYHQMVEIFSEDRVYPCIFLLGIQPHTELASLAIKEGYLKESDDLLGLFSKPKGMLYNPPPLNSLIARSLIEASKKGVENMGVETLNQLKRRLNK